MVELSGIKQVWFVISPQNPHKVSHSLAHEFDRYDMVQAAVADNFNLKVSDVEFQLPKPSYTVDTLAYLSEQFPDHKFSLIIGEDNLISFPRWKNHEAILQYYDLLVYPRPRKTTSTLLVHPHVHRVEAPLIHISATYIRSLIQQGRSIKYLVPEPVEGIIALRNLYR